MTAIAGYYFGFHVLVLGSCQLCCQVCLWRSSPPHAFHRSCQSWSKPLVCCTKHHFVVLHFFFYQVILYFWIFDSFTYTLQGWFTDTGAILWLHTASEVGSQWSLKNMWGVLCQKQVSRAWISNYIPQNLWDVITFPCPWYLLLAKHYIYVSLECNYMSLP